MMRAVHDHGAAPSTQAPSARRHIGIVVLSLVVAIAGMGVKFLAYEWTSSQAIFSDALESIVNVVAAAFDAEVKLVFGADWKSVTLHQGPGVFAGTRK